MEIAVGIPIKSLIPKDKITDSTYYNYYKIRGVIKRYAGESNFYYGVELFYTHAHYNKFDYNYYLEKRLNTYTSDYAEIKKTVFGIAARVGKTLFITNRFYIEYFASAGGRFVKTSLPVNINASPYTNIPHDGFLIDLTDIVGNLVKGHLTFGLQVAYKL